MNILVTGSQGYIGTVLTPMLIQAGHSVTGFDTDFYRNCTFGSSLPEQIYIKKDIRDIELADLVGFDAVVHLAALSNDPLSDLNPELTFDINYRASVRLAEMAKEAGVARFLFSSSCSNYGSGGNDLLTESAKFNPVTPYGQSKVLTERDVSQMADDKFSPVFLRNATAYGISPRLRFDLVLNNLVGWAFTTGKVIMQSDGSPWRPVVHVEDISRAFLTVLNAPRHLVHNRAFNVGLNTENYRIRDIALAVKEMVPNSLVEFAEGASADIRCYRVDCSLLKKTLPQFEPNWNIRKGIAQVHRAFSDIDLTLEDFQGPKYNRIAQIRELIAAGQLDENLKWQN